MATIKKSNTTRIFEDNNFGRFLPILSNENLIEKLVNSTTQSGEFGQINDFVKKKRTPLGTGETGLIDPARIAELLQSISIYGKYTNEIINEIADIEGLGNSLKITYINHEEFKKVKENATIAPDFLNDANINDVIHYKGLSGDNVNDRLNDVTSLTMPYSRNLNNPGLSAIQVINPEFRGCFKHSQELDLFFNMISTLDMSMAIPYVNAEFLIPDKVIKSTSDSSLTNTKKYLTASLNNFILGDDYFTTDENNSQSKYDTSVSDTAKAINGDYYKNIFEVTRNTVKTSSTETQSQIKKTYARQSVNNAIFFAPQTMVNADYDIANNPNAIVDKFRPFMSITNLSFDVRPTKGLMFYKTATLDLILFDKARMSHIAPFIKPELLNTVSSEIILEYGWQHNLGDSEYLRSVKINNQDVIYSENPIGEFINSLKVREKYIIVNSSYTINQNGTVNINLSLAMKGPAELRGLSFQTDMATSKLKSDLSTSIDILKNEIEKGFNQLEGEVVTNQSGSTSTVNNVHKTIKSNLGGLDSELTIQKIDAKDLDDLAKKISAMTTEAIPPDYKKALLDKIKVVSTNLNKHAQSKQEWIKSNFSFLTEHDADKNDPFVDYDWWDSNLGEISVRSNSLDNTVINKKGGWDKKKWISLGKILLSIIGQRLIVENKKYDEIQFVFYNLNGKAIQASFLNIASVPVDKELFEKRLMNLIHNAVKLSAESVLDFILNLTVNQKAAAVYGLGKFFKFTESNSSEIIVAEKVTDDQRKDLINKANAAIKSEIYKQYYGTPLQPEANAVEMPSGPLKELSEIQSGIFDLTFKTGKVVMNFDSTYHEDNPESSILRISFYDEHDNPFESLTEFMTKFHNNDYKNAISCITALRSKVRDAKAFAAKRVMEATPPKKEDGKNKKSAQGKASDTKATVKSEAAKKEEKPTSPTAQPSEQEIKKIYDNVNQAIKRDTANIVYQLIKSDLIVLKDVNGDKIRIDEINAEAPLEGDKIKTVAINIKDNNKIKSFQNMKSLFKTMMPSLTFGQSNSALLSGNISTQQDAKYSTMLLMKQNGEEAEKPPTPYDIEVFSQANNSPMWVIPSQASAQIIGCPIVNFSQLVFLDFNTGTSIDNMYFINGIKHSITPGSFKTDLTLVQKDVYSQFEASATAIAEFLKNANDYENTLKNINTSNNNERVFQSRSSAGINKTLDTGGIGTSAGGSNNYKVVFKINYDKT